MATTIIRVLVSEMRDLEGEIADAVNAVEEAQRMGWAADDQQARRRAVLERLEQTRRIARLFGLLEICQRLLIAEREEAPDAH